MSDDRVNLLRSQVEVLDAIVAALDRRREVLTCISESETPEEAEVALGRLLGVSDVGAKAILNMQVRRATRSDTARIKADREEHRRQLRDLSAD